MNVFAKFDEIPSKTLQDIKETKCHGHTFVRSDGQRENSIPSHKHSVRGGIKKQDHRNSGSGEEDFLRFLPYMGMAPILVM